MGHLIRLWSYRELLWLWTRREVRVRYKQSILGVAWAILQPAAMAVILTLVFSRLLRVPSEGLPYPLFVYTALAPWTAFATAVSQGASSLISHMNLITKAAFPREILPLSTVAASLVDHLCALVVLGLMLLVYRAPMGISLLWLPLLMLLQVISAAAVTLISAALNVFYRDLRFAIPLLLQIWLYATPVIYPLSFVPDRYRPIYVLNPMAIVVEGYRRVLLQGTAPDGGSLAVSLAATLGALAVCYALFKWAEPAFADVI